MDVKQVLHCTRKIRALLDMVGVNDEKNCMRKLMCYKALAELEVEALAEQEAKGGGGDAGADHDPAI